MPRWAKSWLRLMAWLRDQGVEIDEERALEYVHFRKT
jgi:hypothetical protein